MKIFAVDRVKKFFGIVSPSKLLSGIEKIEDTKNSVQPKTKSMYPKDCPWFKDKYCPFDGSSETCNECIVWKENAE